MRDGLPDEGVTSVIKDRNGFVWVGTYSGFSKFDGYRFTNYKHSPTAANSLTNDKVNCLWQDRRGRLWIGHGEGLDLFDPVTEKFYDLWPDSLNLNNRFNNDVNKFRERRDGKLWICTSNGVFLANPHTLFIERVFKLPRYTYHDIAETVDGSVWAASADGLLHVDDSINGTTLYDSRAFRTVEVDKRNRIWVGSEQGLELFNPVDKSFTNYIPNIQPRDVLFNDKMWIGSVKGLYEFDPETGKYNRFGDSYVFSMTSDHQGILWVGSIGGLQQLNPKNKKFITYTQFRDIGALTLDSEGQIWMAASTETRPGDPLLFRFDPTLKHFNQLPRDISNTIGNSSNFITSIFRDNRGGIWLTTNAGLEEFDLKRQTFKKIAPLIEVIAMHVDSFDKFWMGRWDWVSRCDPKDLKGQDAIPSGTVYCFLEDPVQNIWIGTSAGLIKYNLKTSQWKVLRNDPADKQSLSSNTVFHVMMDNKRTVWFGTSGGLNQLIAGGETDAPKFKHWSTEESGLPNDNVYSIVDGMDGTLWMTCGNMISHFFPEQGIFQNYDYGDGISVKNFRGAMYLPGKGVRGQNGEIYFGSAYGLVVFHPDSLQHNSFVPPIRITGFSIHSQSILPKGTFADPLENETPLRQSIPQTDKLKLTYHQNDFTFEFAALNFVNPERNLYRYKLEPYEEEWIETNASNRFARYTNISPGKYTFRVIGSNNHGVWNETGTSLTIIISPPWWRSWWAYSLYVIAFAGLLLAARRNIIQRERLTSKLKLEHLELEKVQEIDKVKTNFFANISHEFRTPITLILGPLKEMYNGTFRGNQKATLGVMMRNGRRLLRLIDQLLDLSKLEVGKMSLQASQSNLVQVLKEIASAHESSAKGKKIKFTLYFEVEELILFIDQEKIEKIIHNILSNAFKFTKENGEVILHLKVENNLQAVISIKDTGIGIPSHELDKVFDRFYQVDSSQTRDYEGSGLGMAVAKELVVLHHGTISVESREGIGSTFIVRLPLGKEHLRKEEIIDAGDFITTKEDSQDLKAEENIVTAETGNEKTTIPSEHLPVLLVVEDNADMRHYIRKTMSDQYQIIEAENGKTGVTLAKESVPDLIISDIMMPEMDGYKLCEIIKSYELTSHIPIILLTAKAERESKLAGLETGADDYLSKPFDADELKLLVRNRIEERRKMRERFSKEITLEPRQIAITSFDEKFLTKVLDIVEKYIGDENFSIDQLSREAGYSNMHFYRKIKALTGETPSQFLRTIRLKRAAELLRKKSDNVTQIAYSVGFASLSYFNKSFKEQFGVTPGQFAEETLKQED